MFPSKEERMQQWAKTRERGLGRFIVINGALGWGLPTSIIWLVLMRFISPNLNLKIYVPLALLVFPLSGLAVGWCIWQLSERKFKKSASA